MNEFWKSKLLNAYKLREQLGLVSNKDTTVYRLVHAEGDGLPGLIIDIYGSTAVIQSHTLGMHEIKDFLSDALKEIYGSKLNTIYDKSAESMAKQSMDVFSNSFLLGSDKDGVVNENGLQFYVNWEEGQKTGFFVDQRENRELLSKYSSGKKVLNTCASS